MDATNGHAMASQQPEPLVQPSGLSVQGPTMQTGRCCFRNSFSSLCFVYITIIHLNIFQVFIIHAVIAVINASFAI